MSGATPFSFPVISAGAAMTGAGTGAGAGAGNSGAGGHWTGTSGGSYRSSSSDSGAAGGSAGAGCSGLGGDGSSAELLDVDSVLSDSPPSRGEIRGRVKAGELAAVAATNVETVCAVTNGEIDGSVASVDVPAVSTVRVGTLEVSACCCSAVRRARTLSGC